MDREKFLEDIYKSSEEGLKEVYKEQEENKENILKENLGFGILKLNQLFLNI